MSELNVRDSIPCKVARKKIDEVRGLIRGDERLESNVICRHRLAHQARLDQGYMDQEHMSMDISEESA